MSPDKQTLDALRINRVKPRRGGPLGALVVGTLLLLAVALGLAWWLNRPRAAIVRTIVVQEAAAPAESGTGTAAAVEKTLLNASGYVTARRQATVSSKVTGKVVEVFVEEGKKVEADEVLARLDTSNVQRSLSLAEAQLESARRALEETKANLDQAERELRRAAQLAAGRAASQAELDRAETTVTSTRARLERQTADVIVSECEVAIWKQQLDDTVIRAPFAGMVTSKDAQPGEIVSPISAGGGFIRTGICTLVDMSSLEIEVDVSESYINRVEPGLPVVATLDAYPSWPIPAKVIAIIPTADRQKATVKVRVGFERLDPRILPEMSVKVAFQSAAEQAAAGRRIVIPKTAIHQDAGQHIVWIVHDDQVERRAVTLGSTAGDLVAIAAGIANGERVVVEGGEKLTERIRVREAE
jgi:RND family efflux transporter MFP subunit